MSDNTLSWNDTIQQIEQTYNDITNSDDLDVAMSGIEKALPLYDIGKEKIRISKEKIKKLFDTTAETQYFVRDLNRIINNNNFAEKLPAALFSKLNEIRQAINMSDVEEDAAPIQELSWADAMKSVETNMALTANTDDLDLANTAMDNYSPSIAALKLKVAKAKDISVQLCVTEEDTLRFTKEEITRASNNQKLIGAIGDDVRQLIYQAIDMCP